MSNSVNFRIFVIVVCSLCVKAWENDELEIFDLVEEINKNFYEELGVKQDATSSEIRKAYRKLSLQLHPDKNKAEGAEVQFRQLVSMYEVLKDPEKRKQYDHVLEFGLPDWRQPVYYYRKVRKFGLLEMALALFLIFTVGHFIVIWSIYFENRFVLEERFNAQKKKSHKGRKGRQKQSEDQEEEELQEELSTVPKPRFIDILPIKCVVSVVRGILSIPGLIKSIQVYMEEQRQRRLEEEERRRQEELEQLQEPQEKKPRQRRQVVEGERCEYEAPVNYTKVDDFKSDDTLQVNIERSGPWTSEDDHLLAKAVAKFPGGISERWVKIANYVGRPTKDVIKKVKSMKTDLSKGIEASAQGITGALGESITMKKGRSISSEISTRSDCDNTAPSSKQNNMLPTSKQGNMLPNSKQLSNSTSSVKTKKTVTFSSENNSVPVDSLLKSNNDKLQVNSSEISSKDGLLWSQNQQKIFEWALGQFPRGAAERWEKIAEHIPGKNKDDCIARFKVLAEIVKKRKQQQAS